MIRKKSRPNESCCDKRKVFETKRGFQIKILSRHRSVCRDIERKQLWSQQIIDVMTRNGCLMNWKGLHKGLCCCDKIQAEDTS